MPIHVQVCVCVGVQEVWEDGYAMNDLNERRSALSHQREHLEAARKVRHITDLGKTIFLTCTALAYLHMAGLLWMACVPSVVGRS